MLHTDFTQRSLILFDAVLIAVAAASYILVVGAGRAATGTPHATFLAFKHLHRLWRVSPISMVDRNCRSRCIPIACDAFRCIRLRA
eukprot:2760726-Prymnesium_polylepis.1